MGCKFASCRWRPEVALRGSIQFPARAQLQFVTPVVNDEHIETVRGTSVFSLMPRTTL